MEATHNVETFIFDRSGLFLEGLRRILKETRYNPANLAVSLPCSMLASQYSTDHSLVILGPNFIDGPPISLEPRHRSRPYRVVVLLHTCSDQRTIAEFRESADAFLLATVSIGLLVKSLDLVMEGVSVMPFEMVAMMSQERVPAECEVLPTTASVASTPEAGQTSNLSEREMLVLQRLMEGASNKIIARDLGIAEATVKVHVKAIFRKASLNNRTQVALWATRQKFISEKLWSNKTSFSRPEDTWMAAAPMIEPLSGSSDYDPVTSRAA